MFDFFTLKKKRVKLADFMLESYRLCFQAIGLENDLRNDYKSRCELLYFLYFCWFMTIPNSGLSSTQQARMQSVLFNNTNELVFIYFLSEDGYNKDFIGSISSISDERDRIFQNIEAQFHVYRSLYDIDKILFLNYFHEKVIGEKYASSGFLDIVTEQLFKSINVLK